MKAVRIAILGASGYSGEELIRLLLRHPQATITCITSRQNAGQPVGKVFPRFAEANLSFSAPDAAEIAKQADVAFLALPHGTAAEYALPLLKAGVRVLDISADFRLKDASIYKKYYKADHPAPELLKTAVYGLPERYREKIRDAQRPGSFVYNLLTHQYPAADLPPAGGTAGADERHRGGEPERCQWRRPEGGSALHFPGMQRECPRVQRQRPPAPAGD